MGFFKKITKAVSKPVKAVVKDAVPIALGVATGGTSLAYVKPTASLEFLGKATGQSSLINKISGVASGSQSIEQVATDYAQEKIENEANRFIDRQLNPNSSSRRINSQSVSNNVPLTQSISDSVSETVESVTNAVGGKKNSILIFGGIGAIILFFFMLKKSGK